MHAEADYGKMWVYMYESVVRTGDLKIAMQYPVMVEERYLMDTTPIPRHDVPKLNMAETLFLFGAGREKRVYAVPPYTHIAPLEFEDYPFRTEHRDGQACERCGATSTFLTSTFAPGAGSASDGESAHVGRWAYFCSDTDFCKREAARRATREEQEVE